MPSKQQLDKAAWQWTERVEPENVKQEHIETAYRINCTVCKSNNCRRNCSGNPCCLSGLGEKAFLQDVDDNAWHDIEDPNSERRPEGGFVGLKNLGATCYLNSFLQVWYHNPAFRHALYLWDPKDDPQEKKKAPTLNGDIGMHKENKSEVAAPYSPSSVTGHLQLIFALLQFSNRKYIDPSPFVNCLGLSTSRQQDAQEFSRLFTSLIEDQLSYQTKESVRSVIQKQYSGEYSYVTRCLQCKTESSRTSEFYELDLNIKGHKDLHQALSEFLKEEQLEGSNQYHCSICHAKQDATRFIQLQRLPPVLNLQLLRFVFDRTSASKKKLNSSIHFPEALDMSPYLRLPKGTSAYNLSAVLIHQGTSANSGHYIAHIRDRETGAWYKFNDETVCKMPGNKLQLAADENSNVGAAGDGKKRKPKLGEGMHDSTNAYMLVYKKDDPHAREFAPDSSVEWDLPDHLKVAVAEDNSKFDEWVAELSAMRSETVKAGKARQSEIRALYRKLPAVEGEPFDWIPTEWLIKWLTEEVDKVPPVDNSFAICQHSMLDPQKVTKMKCISSAAADMIYEKFGGGPRLSPALCSKCVEMQCRYLQVKARVQEDQKEISRMLKFKATREEPKFWVGKLSLQHWKRMVLRQFDEQLVGPDVESSEEGDGDSLLAQSSQENSNNVQVQNEDVESHMDFNEDSRCEHGGLCPDETCRRLTVAAIWYRLKNHFPSAPEFPEDTEVCSLCKDSLEKNNEAQEKLRIQASVEKQCLLDLFLDRSRPNPSLLQPQDIAYVINREFVDQWRKFIRTPLSKPRPTVLSNDILLCPHEKLVGPPDDENVTLVRLHEWEALQQLYAAKPEITVRAPATTEGQLNNVPSSNPEVCSECHAAALRERSHFTRGKVFVRRVSTLDSTTPSNNGPSASTSDTPNGDSFVPAKRKKLDTDVSTATTTCRVSRARRARRGDREITVSASQTLLELKVQVMQEFTVAPFDQHLTLQPGGEPLADNQATLASLGVVPGSILFLTTDEPTSGAMDFEDCTSVPEPEVGFKGTKLQE
ncbi:ubiquitin carboxyl-terminal hydrolase 48-like [Ornithodoros turicata]|uniref:ubiquitin carboxyl-terminal hydrolase 48-like n=1 Tax=Ornithodoros turicata TaxID=34597 RepID=UPI0031392768